MILLPVAGFPVSAGFVKNTADRTCNIPDTGKYADSVGDEQSCNTPRGAAQVGLTEFLPNTAAVAILLPVAIFPVMSDL